MINFKVIATCTSIALLTSCANTTIFPNGPNSFSSVSTSSQQKYAESDAKSKAEAHCKKLGKQLAVSNHQTEYHGADTSTKVAGAIVSGLVGGPNFAVSSSDYEVKMQFKCV